MESVGKRVLDVACSSGWHSRGLARLGASVTAIDIDKSQIDQAIMAQSYSEDARERSVLFKHCDLFDYASDPADLIFCSGLFYHLRDLVGGAKKIFDLSKSGAVIHSHIAPGDGDRMELADANKFIYCFQGEFSFVPTASMLAKILCYVGFSEVRVFRPMDVLPGAQFQFAPSSLLGCAQERHCVLRCAQAMTKHSVFASTVGPRLQSIGRRQGKPAQ